MSVASVDRNDVLAVLRDSYAASYAGGARAVTLTGPMMSGKSSVLRTFADAAAVDGTLVLAATGSSGEQDTPLAVAGQLLRSAGLGLGPDPADRETERVCAPLANAIGEGPALLLVDDAHLADDASLHALLYLLRRIRGTRLLLVLSADDLITGPAVGLVAELSRLLPVTHTRLGMLGVDALADLIGAPDEPDRAAGYHALTGGNPLLAEALLADADWADDPVPGEAYKAAVSACLHRGGAGPLSVARSLALLAATDSRHLLTAIAEVSPAVADQAVAALTIAGLLDTGGNFRHPVIGEVALATLPPADRAAGHRAVAELLHRTGADVTQVATHLLAALESSGETTAAEPPWTGPVLTEAADFSLRDNRPADAVRYARTALRITGDPATRAGVLSLLVAALWKHSPAAAASHVDELGAALTAGHLRAGGVQSLLSTLVWNGRFVEAVAALEWLAGSEATAPAAPAILDWLRHVTPAATVALPEALTGLAATDGDLHHRAASALAASFGGGNPRQIGDAADYVLQNCELGDLAVEPLMSILLALVYVDRLDQAEQWCRRLEGHFDRRAQVTLRAVVLSVGADVALRRGDMPLARARAGRALTLISIKSWGVAVGYPLATHVAASVALGLLDEAAELLSRPVHPAVLDTVFGLPYLHARGRHALVTDRPYAALEHFRTCGRLMVEWDLDVPTFLPWRNSVGEAYLALGRTSDAKAMFDKQAVRARNGAPAVQAVSLRLVAETGIVGDRRPLLQDSVKLLQSSGHLRDLTISLAELSNEYYAHGDPERSRVIGRRAIEVSASCDALGVAKQLLLGGDRFDLAGLVEESDEHTYPQLTDAESRVARLAAEGLTNREIGRKLFLSMSTVEQRLTRVFRKLGVTRRTDLVGLAHHHHTDAVPVPRAVNE